MRLKNNQFNDNFSCWLDDSGVKLATLISGQKNTAIRNAQIDLDKLKLAIESCATQMARDNTTFDSIEIGWEGKHHYRIVCAIRGGKIINRHKVSDDTLRKYFGDNYDQAVQLYGKEYLLPFDR